jgi:hypothetical protein
VVTRIPRTVTFLPGLAAAGWGWTRLGEPYRFEGLAALEGGAVICWALLAVAAVAVMPAGLLGEWLRLWARWARTWQTWPLLIVTVALVIPAGLLSGLWPRGARKWWRHRPWWLGNQGRETARSSYIPGWTRQVVYAADRWRCWYCGGQYGPVDHGCPWSLGGRTCLANLWGLCDRCNLAKSNAWLFRGRFWAGASTDPALAEDILRALRWHRLNVLRWLRLAWALGA